MRVTMEHREAVAGITATHKECFIDCNVQFSEEERAIIKERDLYREGFTIRTSTPSPSNAAFWTTNIMRAVGPLMVVGGFIYGMVVEGFGHAPSNYGGPILFIGIGLTMYGWIRSRREDKRFETSEQRITVKQLLSNPTFTVHTWNAGYAKTFEDEIRQNLVSLKSLIKGSAQLQAKQTFEL